MSKENNITLRPSRAEDLEFFFQFQLDEEAGHLAAFMPKEPGNKPAYMDKYSRLLKDPTVNMMTIMFGNDIAGSISKFEMKGDAEITYWIDRKFWNKGIASTALSVFLTKEKMRPIFARTAFDNFGSQKVLEKCGFVRIGRDRGFANARNAEIEEFIYKLA